MIRRKDWIVVVEYGNQQRSARDINCPWFQRVIYASISPD